MITAAGLMVLRPPPDRTTAEWADENRVLPKGSAEPGRWRSSRAPHMIQIADAIQDPAYSKVCAVMGSQMSKTETMCNAMGHRLDDDPAPQLYIAPTKSFVESVFEPRFRAMTMQCESLAAKRKAGKQEKKTLKEIAGVKVRFAWAGSATELAGEPARDVYVDERDRMDDNVDGEGDPVELADARHSTYADGCTTIFSTPTLGNLETYIDPQSKLEFWDVVDEIQSATWKIWQEGTMYHWAVPCPECKEFFIPRFKNLWWPENATPTQAHDEAHLACTNCSILIDQSHKTDMHAAGVFVAPGQSVTAYGEVLGDPPISSTASFWVSGLMSPWKSWGDRAQQFLLAVRSGDPERIQAAINTGFGELYSVAGEAPDVQAVRALRQPYKLGQCPDGVVKITCGVDVRKDGLHYSVRGWGVDMEAWHIEHGELVGPTDEEQVWNDLALLRDRHYGNNPIERCFIDSGYRTSYVYTFCRKFRTWAFPTKGRDTIESSPLTRGKLDVAKNSGKRLAGGLGIWHINTDYFKRWLHERFERDPSLPGGWHLAEDTSEEFCKAMVSEARLVKASGRVKWILIHANNHYFDCEVNNLAAAYSLNMQSQTSVAVEARHKRMLDHTQESDAIQKQAGVMHHGTDPFRTNNHQSGGWFGRK